MRRLIRYLPHALALLAALAVARLVLLGPPSTGRDPMPAAVDGLWEREAADMRALGLAEINISR